MIKKDILRVLAGRRISVVIIIISSVLILLSVVTIVSDIISIKNAEKHLANLHRNQIEYVARVNSINAAIDVGRNAKEAMTLSLFLKNSVNDSDVKRDLSLLEVDIKRLSLLYKNKSHIAVDFKKELKEQAASGKIKIGRFNKLQKILDNIIDNPGSAVLENEPYSFGHIKSEKVNAASRKRFDYAENIETVSNAIADVRNRIRTKEDFVLHQFIHLSNLHMKKAVKKYAASLRHIGLLMLLIFLQFVWLIFIIIAKGRSSRRINNAAIDLALVLSKTDLTQMKFALEKMAQIIDADAVLLGTIIDGGFINYSQFFIKKKHSAIIPSDEKYNLVIGKHAAGKAKTSKRPIIINAYQKFSHAHQEWKKAGLREFAGAPLFYRSGEYFGQLSAIRFSDRKFTKDNLKLLELFSNMIINLFENERNNKRINLFYERMKKLAYGIRGGGGVTKEKGITILSILKKTEMALETDNLFFYDKKEDLLYTNKLEHPISLNDIKDIIDLTGAALLIGKRKDEIINCRSFIFEGGNTILIAEAIKTEERCYGVLICFYQNSEDLEMRSLSLKIVAANILLSLINYSIRKEHVSIISAYDEQIIRLMISSMEIRDTYTRGHSERVSYYSEILGKLCGVKGEDEEILKMAALFHDIGKIGIPDMILLKPGKLTRQEYRMIQLHPVISGDIIGQVKQLRRLVPAIKYHHERWDAGGYPDGRAGIDIPYLSRIISVADVMDAVLTTRPYRDAFSDDQTRRLLIKEQGKQFDPEIAAIAIDNFDKLKNYATRHKSTYSKLQIAYPELDIWRRIYFDIDYATGLLKPEIFDKQMNKFKKDNRPFRLFMIDMENLGKINLKNGIAEGDKLIKNIADCLSKMQTKYGFRDLARYGGDSFTFIMLKEDIEAGYDIEKISLEIVKMLNKTGIKLHITSSDFPENHSPLHYAKSKLHNIRE